MIEWYGEQVETIVISVISMLSDPTDESPANIDAAVSMFRPFEYICMHALSERAITTFSWLCGCASRSFHMPPELWPSDTIFPLFLDLGIRVATNLFFLLSACKRAENDNLRNPGESTRLICPILRKSAFSWGFAEFSSRLQALGLLRPAASNSGTSNSRARELWEKGVRGPMSGTSGGERQCWGAVRLAAARLQGRSKCARIFFLGSLSTGIIMCRLPSSFLPPLFVLNSSVLMHSAEGAQG